MRALTDGNGVVTDRYSYTAYGGVHDRQGTTVNPYQYTGQQSDSETGLSYLRARYYSPVGGQFLSRDPAAVNLDNPRELNRYGYVGANPINYGDPTGYLQGPAPTVSAPTQLPTRGGGGGPAGEYAALALAIAIAIAPAVRRVGEEVACKFYYVASVVAAAAKNKAGLLGLERIAPKRCIIPIVKYYHSNMPDHAQHIQDAQDDHWPMLLTYNGPGHPDKGRTADELALMQSSVVLVPSRTIITHTAATNTHSHRRSKVALVPLRGGCLRTRVTCNET